MADGFVMLVVEDDDGDAFLVEEMCMDADPSLRLIRAATLGEAMEHVSEVDVVLLGPGLSDAADDLALQRLAMVDPRPPVIVLAGHDGPIRHDPRVDEYFVTGMVDAWQLTRAVRYVAERATLRNELESLRSAQAGLDRDDPMRGTGRLPNKAESSCLLIGTSEYADSDMYPALPAVENNLKDLAAILTHEELGGFASDRVHIELNPTKTIGEKLADLAESTRDVLFVYYAGHGTVDNDGELYYALPTTRANRIWSTGLPHQWVRRAMLNCPAVARVLILDCCFSGRAIEAMSDPESSLTGQLEISGAYTLTATTSSNAARAPRGEAHTAFTGELLRLLGNGLANHGPLLNITALYSPLTRALIRRGFSYPQQRGTGTIGDLALTKNAVRGTFASS